jgi:hypothetical protein
MHNQAEIQADISGMLQRGANVLIEIRHAQAGQQVTAGYRIDLGQVLKTATQVRRRSTTEMHGVVIHLHISLGHPGGPSILHVQLKLG